MQIKGIEQVLLLCLVRRKFIERFDVSWINSALYTVLNVVNEEILLFAIDLFLVYKQFVTWFLCPGKSMDVCLTELLKLNV